jgi:hypothetical protein
LFNCSIGELAIELVHNLHYLRLEIVCCTLVTSLIVINAQNLTLKVCHSGICVAYCLDSCVEKLKQIELSNLNNVTILGTCKYLPKEVKANFEEHGTDCFCKLQLK